MMKRPTCQAHLGLLAGAGAGGLATAAGIVLVMAVPAAVNSPPSPVDLVTWAMTAIMALVMLIPFTTIVFGTALVLVGLPAWAALHWMGFRSRATASVTGGLLSGMTALGLALAMGGSASGGGSFGAFMVLPGVAAGWTLHRVAYGKAGPSPA